jgi:hypothetical protein
VTNRRRIVVLALLVLAALSVLVAPSSNAQQILPQLPPLPAPPADGNLLADILGPASLTACNTVATAYGLVGPIAAAQLPPDLQPLVGEVDPYLALITYACGYLVSPPSTFRCAIDTSVTQQLGLLGLPVGPPTVAQIFYETAAGIEHAFLRLGLDVGTDASQQIATALGCGVPVEADPGAPAALPPSDAVPAVAPLATGGSFSSGKLALPAVPSVVARPPVADTSTVLPGSAGRLGALSYPVREAAALLLALPLVLLAGGVALGPRLCGHRRKPRAGAPPRVGGSS